MHLSGRQSQPGGHRSGQGDGAGETAAVMIVSDRIEKVETSPGSFVHRCLNTTAPSSEIRLQPGPKGMREAICEQKPCVKWATYLLHFRTPSPNVFQAFCTKHKAQSTHVSSIKHLRAKSLIPALPSSPAPGT